MLHLRGINWNDYPARFKRGQYVTRVQTEKAFTPEEIAALPEKHLARMHPNLIIKRIATEFRELPRLTQIINRKEVLFEGAEPILDENS